MSKRQLTLIIVLQLLAVVSVGAYLLTDRQSGTVTQEPSNDQAVSKSLPASAASALDEMEPPPPPPSPFVP